MYTTIRTVIALVKKSTLLIPSYFITLWNQHNLTNWYDNMSEFLKSLIFFLVINFIYLCHCTIYYHFQHSKHNVDHV